MIIRKRTRMIKNERLSFSVMHRHEISWLSLPHDIRSHVKEQVVHTLGTEPFRPSIAAQCVAAIACAELPSGLWPDVIASLMSSVTNTVSSAVLKESSLETLGYICQDIDAKVGMLEYSSNFIHELLLLLVLLSKLKTFLAGYFNIYIYIYIYIYSYFLVILIFSTYITFNHNYYSVMSFSVIIANVIDEGDDEDDWTPAKAAGVCIMLLAQCVGDAILDSVISSNWKYKEAAIMAFGSILDGPDPAKLMTLVEQAMPALIQSMSDKHVTIRDTCGWTIGRVLEVCPEIVNKDGLLGTLLPAMSLALNQEPRVAANVCWALVALVKAAYDTAVSNGTDSTGQPDTYILSACFEAMISELIKTTDRYTSASLIESNQLNLLELKNQLVDLQALLCATLQSVLRKMRPEDAAMIGEHVMGGLIQIMNRTTVGKGGSVMEEALLAVSVLAESKLLIQLTLANYVLPPITTRLYYHRRKSNLFGIFLALNNGFLCYVEALKPHLMRGLSNHDEPQVCAAAVGLVTDMCRAMETNIAPALDDIMSTLIQSLQSPRLDRDVKVTILGCFGDVALAIGEHFERYICVVMDMLSEAASAAVVSNPVSLFFF
uniref:Importin N-terminal domain-containing protein n=1 Tax=Heterorhabditis bacteriophora TaxID=37862 RepID=A0A1I7WNE0_HETBA